ncbi:MAG: MerR family DNA-binding transcriptional regulator [Rhodobacteraceae bacterium]|nr:MerR family DNA-binding transcriptional regulator [Paracoccaceae bacterium]
MMENCISFKQMCEKFGCTARTLRHYEEIELLFPQKEGRSRWYCRREIARMKLIMRGRRFEFSLEGIRQWLLMYDGEKNNIEQINAWIEMATNQIEELKAKRITLDQSINELKSLRDHSIKSLNKGNPSL